MSKQRLLVINPGSTSTKLAYFVGKICRQSETITHPQTDLEFFSHSIDQLKYRLMSVGQTMHKWQITMDDIDAVIGRGAALGRLESGVYKVNRHMVADIRDGKCLADHPSLLGALMARKLTAALEKPAYIVDPVSVDEMWDKARLSGIKEIERISLWHALNSRYTANLAAKKHGLAYETCKMVVAHLGSGISVSAHINGQAVDVNNANDMGAFSANRAGALPVTGLVKLCFSGRYNSQEMINLLTKHAGLMSYLNTSDLREVEASIKNGDKQAKLVFDAMSYQIAKEIGAMHVACGAADLIVLTGEMAKSQSLIDSISSQISCLSKVETIPGEHEMQALAYAVIDMLENNAQVKVYQSL